jgi:hypothetical protein
VPLKTLNPPDLRRLARAGAFARVKELQEVTAALLRIKEAALKPKADDNTRSADVHAGEQHVTRQLDDFSVFQHPDRTTWGVCGLKLSTDILTFPNRAEATARGTALARASRVSLWFEPTGHRRDGVLVVSYRHEQVRQAHDGPQGRG